MLSAEIILLALLGAPGILAAWAFGPGRHTPRMTGHLGAAVAAGGLLSTLLLVFITPGAAVTAGPIGFAVDRLSVILLLLVFGVSSITQAFAVRYLAGDSRAAWFTGGAGLLTAASAGLVTASTLIGLALCWSLAGAALCLLLAIYRLPSARDGLRRTAAAFLVGDLALWVAVVLATVTWGPVTLASAGGQASGPLVPVVALLVALAALSRSAQIPFHRWLPATLAAPTPVSALLHAGVVNAGGILLIRLAPMTASGVAQLLVGIAGAATMVYGATIMLIKPDIKGALVHSTTAQMGFMILTCGLGLWVATVIHLVAHGFYKATLFLASGSAIAHGRRARSIPPPDPAGSRGTGARAATAIFLPAAALALALVISPGGALLAEERTAEKALLVFAWVTGAAVIWGWMQRRPGPLGALTGSAFLVPIAIAYVATIHAIGDYLKPSLPPATLPAAAVWAGIVASLAVLGLSAVVRRAPATGRLQRALYSRALSAGHIPTPTMAGASS